MKNLKISIITPVLNSKDYIEKAINSVINQNYPFTEHIIVDAGSKDGTIEIIQKYKNIILISKNNCGISEAFNKGLEISTGDIIGWLNSDDIYLENAFNIVMENFRKNPDIDILYGDCIYIDKNDNVIMKYRSGEFSLNKLLNSCYNIIPPMSAFIKKRVFEKLEYPLDKDLKYSMDHDLFIRIGLSKSVFKYYKYYFSAFRRTDKNITSIKAKEMRKESYKLCKRYLGKATFRLRMNYFISILYYMFPLLTKFIRRLRYKISLIKK